MVFNSFAFLVFFPIVACLYFLFPPRFRWFHLLVASYVFYMAWEPVYLVLILASTIVDYTAGLAMGRAPTQGRRRACLLGSLFCNLGLLFSFKYLNFLTATFRAFFEAAGLSFEVPSLQVLLPVGISFYTFQTLSYTIEVYRGHQEPERHLGRFALYVAFFPQLVAGPIERAGNLLPQLRRTHRFDPDRAVQALRLILWGMFKKVVIADRLAIVVDAIYSDPAQCPGPVLIFGTVCFAYQIYCDFSGYSDIAIGCARLLGIDLMTNFDRPYHARSIPEFWQRWHISLSTWFRDYVYYPLGGNHVSKRRWGVNILVVFALSGLWHGANWTFVVWGLLHAGYYLTSRMTGNLRKAICSAIGLEGSPRIHAGLQLAITFVLVNVGWIFFRADTIGDAVYVLTHLCSGWHFSFFAEPIVNVARFTGVAPVKILAMLACLAMLVLAERIGSSPEATQALQTKPAWFRWFVYVGLALGIMNLGVTHEIPFVYFQF